jgi:hypothetical protein
MLTRVHRGPGPSVTCADRDGWVSADAREPRRMRPHLRPAGPAGQLARARSGDDLDQLNLRHDGPAQGGAVRLPRRVPERAERGDRGGMGTDSVYLWTLPMFHCSGWCFPWAVTAVAARHVTMRGGPRARVGAHRRRGRDALPAVMKPSASRRQHAQGSECLRRLWGRVRGRFRSFLWSFVTVHLSAS